MENPITGVMVLIKSTNPDRKIGETQDIEYSCVEDLEYDMSYDEIHGLAPFRVDQDGNVDTYWVVYTSDTSEFLEEGRDKLKEISSSLYKLAGLKIVSSEFLLSGKGKILRDLYDIATTQAEESATSFLKWIRQVWRILVAINPDDNSSLQGANFEQLLQEVMGAYYRRPRRTRLR